MAEMPANGGLLRFRNRSPGSQFGYFGSEIADSLRRRFEIFPFLGDEGRRPGSIGTAWRARQCNSTLDVRIILHQNLASAEADRFAANPYQLRSGICAGRASNGSQRPLMGPEPRCEVEPGPPGQIGCIREMSNVVCTSGTSSA